MKEAIFLVFSRYDFSLATALSYNSYVKPFVNRYKKRSSLCRKYKGKQSRGTKSAMSLWQAMYCGMLNKKINSMTG